MVVDCQASRNVCGIILFPVSYKWLKRRDVFSGPLPEGWALVEEGWLLCLQNDKKEKNGKEGGQSQCSGKAFFSPSSLSLYRSSKHPPTY